ncbi:MAG: T9SS type A sorting domain-containing protein [Bacteroidota bacterium]|nr:T9SS type A sorting domain-containing protein [Bacteroidota bacterium]
MKTNAQIPNSGFESWTTVAVGPSGSYQYPNEWATSNPVCTGPFYSCTRSTDHFPLTVGNFSVRLENNTSLTRLTGGFGIATTDTAYPFRPSFAITGHPNSLCGYYKYAPLNNDTMFIRIVLFKNGTMVNYFTFKSGISTSTWTSFTLPLTYTSADSAMMYMMAFYPSSPTGVPNGNSVLYVDNLSFDNLISSVSEPGSENTIFNLYPNPSSDKITIANTENSEETYIRILNIQGRQMMHSQFQNQNNLELDISALPMGIYFIEVNTESEIVVKKFIKE